METPQRTYQAVAVVEVTLVRPVDEAASHDRASAEASAELASGTSDQWSEASRRVKSVVVRAE